MYPAEAGNLSEDKHKTRVADEVVLFSVFFLIDNGLSKKKSNLTIASFYKHVCAF